ncbi:MAG: isoprenylcysteine carboxylmethyltransferase family protein [Chloroflexota bacterium]
MIHKAQQFSIHLLIWAAAILLLPMLAFPLTSYTRLISAPYSWIGILGILAGISLLSWATLHMVQSRTTLNPLTDPRVLVTEGPFRLSRNPMYLGTLLAYTGLAVFVGSLQAWCFPLIFFAAANWLFIPYEETILKQVFAENYEAYRRAVRRWV